VVEVDDAVFSLRGGTRIDVTDGDDAAGARIATSRAAIVDVLDAEVSLSEAVESDRLVV